MICNAEEGMCIAGVLADLNQELQKALPMFLLKVHTLIHAMSEKLLTGMHLKQNHHLDLKEAQIQVQQLSIKKNSSANT